MFEVRPRVRELRRLFALHRQPQLGASGHLAGPAVHHHRVSAHRRALHVQVQGHQGDFFSFPFFLVLQCNAKSSFFMFLYFSWTNRSLTAIVFLGLEQKHFLTFFE